MASQIEAAAHFGISVKRFRELVGRGAIPVYPPGEIDLDEARLHYLKWTREQLSNRGSEKERLDAARADQVEYDLAIKRADHVPTELMVSVLGQIIADIRGRLLGLSVKLAPQVIGHDRIPSIEAIIQDEIHAALGELSRETIDLGMSLGGALITAEETDCKPVGRGKPPPKRRSKRRAGTVAQ